MMLTVRSWRQEPYTVVELAGELQHLTAPAAEAEIMSVVRAGPVPLELVVDLTGVGFLDSGGVNLLARTRSAVRSADGRVRLVAAPSGRPRQVLRVTGLDQVLPVLDSLAHALDGT